MMKTLNTRQGLVVSFARLRSAFAVSAGSAVRSLKGERGSNPLARRLLRHTIGCTVICFQPLTCAVMGVLTLARVSTGQYSGLVRAGKR